MSGKAGVFKMAAADENFFFGGDALKSPPVAIGSGSESVKSTKSTKSTRTLLLDPDTSDTLARSEELTLSIYDVYSDGPGLSPEGNKTPPASQPNNVTVTKTDANMTSLSLSNGVQNGVTPTISVNGVNPSEKTDRKQTESTDPRQTGAYNNEITKLAKAQASSQVSSTKTAHRSNSVTAQDRHPAAILGPVSLTPSGSSITLDRKSSAGKGDSKQGAFQFKSSFTHESRSVSSSSLHDDEFKASLEDTLKKKSKSSDTNTSTGGNANDSSGKSRAKGSQASGASSGASSGVGKAKASYSVQAAVADAAKRKGKFESVLTDNKAVNGTQKYTSLNGYSSSEVSSKRHHESNQSAGHVTDAAGHTITRSDKTNGAVVSERSATVIANSDSSGADVPIAGHSSNQRKQVTENGETKNSYVNNAQTGQLIKEGVQGKAGAVSSNVNTTDAEESAISASDISLTLSKASNQSDPDSDWLDAHSTEQWNRKQEIPPAAQITRSESSQAQQVSGNKKSTGYESKSGSVKTATAQGLPPVQLRRGPIPDFNPNPGQNPSLDRKSRGSISSYSLTTVSGRDSWGSSVVSSMLNDDIYDANLGILNDPGDGSASISKSSTKSAVIKKGVKQSEINGSSVTSYSRRQLSSGADDSVFDTFPRDAKVDDSSETDYTPVSSLPRSPYQELKDTVVGGHVGSLVKDKFKNLNLTGRMVDPSTLPRKKDSSSGGGDSSATSEKKFKFAVEGIDVPKVDNDTTDAGTAADPEPIVGIPSPPPVPDLTPNGTDSLKKNLEKRGFGYVLDHKLQTEIKERAVKVSSKKPHEAITTRKSEADPEQESEALVQAKAKLQKTDSMKETASPIQRDKSGHSVMLMELRSKLHKSEVKDVPETLEASSETHSSSLLEETKSKLHKRESGIYKETENSSNEITYNGVVETKGGTFELKSAATPPRDSGPIQTSRSPHTEPSKESKTQTNISQYRDLQEILILQTSKDEAILEKTSRNTGAVVQEAAIQSTRAGDKLESTGSDRSSHGVTSVGKAGIQKTTSKGIPQSSERRHSKDNVAQESLNRRKSQDNSNTQQYGYSRIYTSASGSKNIAEKHKELQQILMKDAARDTEIIVESNVASEMEAPVQEAPVIVSASSKGKVSQNAPKQQHGTANAAAVEELAAILRDEGHRESVEIQDNIAQPSKTNSQPVKGTNYQVETGSEIRISGSQSSSKTQSGVSGSETTEAVTNERKPVDRNHSNLTSSGSDVTRPRQGEQADSAYHSDNTTSPGLPQQTTGDIASTGQLFTGVHNDTTHQAGQSIQVNYELQDRLPSSNATHIDPILAKNSLFEARRNARHREALDGTQAGSSTWERPEEPEGFLDHVGIPREDDVYSVPVKKQSRDKEVQNEVHDPSVSVSKARQDRQDSRGNLKHKPLYLSQEDLLLFALSKPSLNGPGGSHDNGLDTGRVSPSDNVPHLSHGYGYEDDSSVTGFAAVDEAPVAGGALSPPGQVSVWSDEGEDKDTSLSLTDTESSVSVRVTLPERNGSHRPYTGGMTSANRTHGSTGDLHIRVDDSGDHPRPRVDRTRERINGHQHRSRYIKKGGNHKARNHGDVYVTVSGQGDRHWNGDPDGAWRPSSPSGSYSSISLPVYSPSVSRTSSISQDQWGSRNNPHPNPQSRSRPRVRQKVGAGRPRLSHSAERGIPLQPLSVNVALSPEPTVIQTHPVQRQRSNSFHSTRRPTAAAPEFGQAFPGMNHARSMTEMSHLSDHGMYTQYGTRGQPHRGERAPHSHSQLRPSYPHRMRDRDRGESFNSHGSGGPRSPPGRYLRVDESTRGRVPIYRGQKLSFRSMNGPDANNNSGFGKPGRGPGHISRVHVEGEDVDGVDNTSSLLEPGYGPGLGGTRAKYSVHKVMERQEMSSSGQTVHPDMATGQKKRRVYQVSRDGTTTLNSHHGNTTTLNSHHGNSTTLNSHHGNSATLKSQRTTLPSARSPDVEAVDPELQSAVKRGDQYNITVKLNAATGSLPPGSSRLDQHYDMTRDERVTSTSRTARSHQRGTYDSEGYDGRYTWESVPQEHTTYNYSDSRRRHHSYGDPFSPTSTGEAVSGDGPLRQMTLVRLHDKDSPQATPSDSSYMAKASFKVRADAPELQVYSSESRAYESDGEFLIKSVRESERVDVSGSNVRRSRSMESQKRYRSTAEVPLLSSPPPPAHSPSPEPRFSMAINQTMTMDYVAPDGEPVDEKLQPEKQSRQQKKPRQPKEGRRHVKEEHVHRKIKMSEHDLAQYLSPDEEVDYAPEDKNMPKVVRGSILIKNSIDTTGAAKVVDIVEGDDSGDEVIVEDNVNPFHGRYLQQRENPMYSSDQDLSQWDDVHTQVTKSRKPAFTEIFDKGHEEEYTEIKVTRGKRLSLLSFKYLNQ